MKMFVYQYRKRALVSLFAFAILSVPLLSYVVYALNNGYSILEQIADEREPQVIRTMIRSARGDFERSNFLLTPFSWIPLSQVDSIHRVTA